MALEFLLMSLGFNSYLLLRDEQNSKCWGVLVMETREGCIPDL
jgi:hypothetical protein